MSKLDDVGLTYIVGEQPEEFTVEPNPQRLALFGITLQQLSAKIAGADKSFLAGGVRIGGKQVGLVGGQTLQSADEIGNILITARDGRPVYVRDVATVVLRTSPNETIVTDIATTAGGLQRTPAVSIAIAKRPGTNAVAIADRIVRRLGEVRGQILPADINLKITRNYGRSANDKANELLFHLASPPSPSSSWWRWRSVCARQPWWPSSFPPPSLLTLFAAWMMGYTINRVSLFALIFSIGILVDDAIVVIENIHRHWAMADERSRMQAAIDAVAEVGNPTIVATLTVVAALLPMLFVSGLMGPYMSPIPANASAAMIFSFFVAVMLTPWLMMKIAGRAGHGTHKPSAHGAGGILGRGYRLVAAPILASRARAWAFLLVVGVATLASLALLYTENVTVKLLPFDNKTELQVVVDLPEGSSRGGDRPGTARRRRACRRAARDHIHADLRRHRRTLQLQRSGAPLLSAQRAADGRCHGQPQTQGRALAHQP